MSHQTRARRRTSTGSAIPGPHASPCAPSPGSNGRPPPQRCTSPEDRAGAGTDSRKWSTSLRAERHLGNSGIYGLAEWARTSEAEGVFVFHSVLIEAALTTGRHQPYYRFERTERPEEMRALDAFRTERPHLDNSILGITRWSIHTAGYGVRFAAARRLTLEPFVEVSTRPDRRCWAPVCSIQARCMGGTRFDQPASDSASTGVCGGTEWDVTGSLWRCRTCIIWT